MILQDSDNNDNKNNNKLYKIEQVSLVLKSLSNKRIVITHK